MSPQRTIAELEDGLAASRSELELALADLRASVRRASDVRARAERYRAQIMERFSEGGDELVAAAVAAGFITGGGVQGSIRMPVASIRMIVGYPSSRKRMERAMREDRYSRSLGRSLAALASADRHMRSRRVRLWRLIRPSPRRLVTIASAGSGLYLSKVDDQKRQMIETEARALLETVTTELRKKVDAVGREN